MLRNEVKEALFKTRLFAEDKAYVLVDGQYGSTGKGLVASVLAEAYAGHVDLVTSNAGPNSGHTSYFGDEKVVLMQLPTFAVHQALMGYENNVLMNAGAIIKPERYKDEKALYPNVNARVHPSAALVTDEALEVEKNLVDAVGSTGKGTGAALAAKIMRQGPIAKSQADLGLGFLTSFNTALVEVSQGFSLGINQGFYPHCTSRECTVQQAMADAEIHPSRYGGSIMVVRTYPIRVAGNSGPCYYDQHEISWDDLGVEPERTTVTNKVRRVFTWSDAQFRRAVYVNRPEVLFVNFVNYLPTGAVPHFIDQRVKPIYNEVMGKDPEAILLGFGPKNEDVRAY